MLKKLVCAVFAVVMICSGSIAHAKSVLPDPAPNSVATRMDYTRTTLQTLSISSKTATVKCSITGYGTITTKVRITAYLQKKDGTKWADVTNWSQTSNTYRGSITKTKSVSAGTYRVKVVYTAYSGSKNESMTKYSGTATC